MAYDEVLAARVRDLIAPRPGVAERRMFGSLGWTIGGNLACSVSSNGLIVRLSPEEVEDACREPHVGPFSPAPGRRPMSGFVLVAPEALDEEAALARWVDCGADRAASMPPK